MANRLTADRRARAIEARKRRRSRVRRPHVPDAMAVLVRIVQRGVASLAELSGDLGWNEERIRRLIRLVNGGGPATVRSEYGPDGRKRYFVTPPPDGPIEKPKHRRAKRARVYTASSSKPKRKSAPDDWRRLPRRHILACLEIVSELVTNVSMTAQELAAATGWTKERVRDLIRLLNGSEVIYVDAEYAIDERRKVYSLSPTAKLVGARITGKG